MAETQTFPPTDELVVLNCPACGAPLAQFEGDTTSCQHCNSLLARKENALEVTELGDLVEQAKVAVETDTPAEYTPANHDSFVNTRKAKIGAFLQKIGMLSIASGLAVGFVEAIANIPPIHVTGSDGPALSYQLVFYGIGTIAISSIFTKARPRPRTREHGNEE